MRVLWHSGAPWVGTGYGVQTALATTRLRDAGHDVAISATWGLTGSILDWDGIPVYPSDENWGNTLLPHVAKKHRADVTVTLMDVWALKPQVFAEMANLACWCPVDHQPTPPRVTQFFKLTGARPIAMSRFGERMLKDDGLDPLYVPHAVDTNVYAPSVHDRRDVRESMGLPREAFIVGMVANNSGHTPPRKAFPQAIMAFSEIRKRHPDALLYLHSEVTGSGIGNKAGVNLMSLCEKFGVPPDAVGFAPQVELELGIPPESMAAAYAAFDVLLCPSYGEGFGVPIIEAQACGTPVIVTDWTAMPELVGAGWLVGGEPWWDVQHGAFYLCPFVADIVDALEQAYEHRGDQELRDKARAFALQYDADRVFQEYWVPALEVLSRPREVPPLLPSGANRQMRRAAKRLKAA